jgi:hypothetical protein
MGSFYALYRISVYGFILKKVTLARTGKEAVMNYLKIISQHLPENNETPQCLPRFEP